MVQLADPKEPNDLLFSAGSISSGIIVDGLVGKLSVSDPNLFDQHLFSLVPGDGDKDNDLVYLRSSDLRLLSTISEGQSELKFRIRVTDMTGLSYEKSLFHERNNNQYHQMFLNFHPQFYNLMIELHLQLDKYHLIYKKRQFP